MSKQFTTRPAHWQSDKAALMQVRDIVFVQGQGVPQSLESDDYDSVSYYVLAESPESNPIGCARLQPNGKITRIAVLNDYRRQGIAAKMLADIINIADSNNIQPLYLHAQITAMTLYEKFGFVKTGEQFEEAGIKHIKMTKPVP